MNLQYAICSLRLRGGADSKAVRHLRSRYCPQSDPVSVFDRDRDRRQNNVGGGKLDDEDAGIAWTVKGAKTRGSLLNSSRSDGRPRFPNTGRKARERRTNDSDIEWYPGSRNLRNRPVLRRGARLADRSSEPHRVPRSQD
jgi:hypothetical protein